jgi:hypothetical protein
VGLSLPPATDRKHERLEEEQMTPDQIRTLLGGYATNTLTEEERKVLFEAALDDQELFNTLHDEDALREILADPVSRAQIGQALEASARKKRPAFWAKGWVLSTAAGAAASVVALIIWLQRPEPAQPPVQVAATLAQRDQPAIQVQQKSEAVAQRDKPKTLSRARTVAKNVEPAGEAVAAAPATPPPVIPAPVQLESARDAVAPAAPPLAVPARAPNIPPGQQQFLGGAAPAAASFGGAQPAQLPDSIRRQFSGGFAANAPLYQGPLVRYKILKTGSARDEVRVEVSTLVAGYVALYQMDAAGNSKRVYPVDEPAFLVLPDLAVQIPNNPVKLGEVKERLRLVVVPAPARTATVGQLIAPNANEMKKTEAISAPASAAPMVIDIPLGQN